MSKHSGALLVLSINHENVPLEERETYSVEGNALNELYQRMRQLESARESLILNTCNRFEIYALSQDPSDTAAETLRDQLAAFHGIESSALERHAKVRHGIEAIQHLIEVAAGLRSQIVGEAEILGQVKTAYALCQQEKAASTVINRMFQKGFQAAKLIRSSTPIGEGQLSIASVAVSLSLKIYGDLSRASALVIGTGEIGEKTTKALKSKDVSRFGIVSRSPERAREAAQKWGGEALSMNDLDAYLEIYDIIVASTVVERPIIDEAMIRRAARRRKGRPLFLIDMGMPRNIDARCDDLDDVFIYNLDDLAEIAEDNLAERRKAIRQSKQIAQQKAEFIWDNLRKRGLVS